MTTYSFPAWVLKCINVVTSEKNITQWLEETETIFNNTVIKSNISHFQLPVDAIVTKKLQRQVLVLLHKPFFGVRFSRTTSVNCYAYNGVSILRMKVKVTLIPYYVHLCTFNGILYCLCDGMRLRLCS